MWTVKGEQLDPLALGDLTPIDIFDEYEGILVFTAADPLGGLLLAYNLSGSADAFRYIVVPTNASLISRLTTGLTDVLGFLKQPRTWIVDIGKGWTPAALWSVDIVDIPPTVLPERGVMFSPELEPLFTLKLIGEGLGEGKTTASDIRLGAATTEDSLKRIVEITLEERRRRGMQTGKIRRYYDLTMQSLRAASLEISFAKPKAASPTEAAEDASVLDEMGKLLEAGLALAEGNDKLIQAYNLSEPETLSLLEAIKGLTPSSQRGLDEVRISGSLLAGRTKPVTLTHDSRSRVNRQIKSRRTPQVDRHPFQAFGWITEADKDESKFTLRNASRFVGDHLTPVDDIVFYFNDEDYEEVMEAFVNNEFVSVVGVTSGKRILSRAIEILLPVTFEAEDRNALPEQKALPDRADEQNKDRI